MREQRVSVEIDDEGRVSAEAEGFAGDTCLRELDRLLDGLGQPEDVVRKPEATPQPARRSIRVRLEDGSES